MWGWRTIKQCLHKDQLRDTTAFWSLDTLRRLESEHFQNCVYVDSYEPIKSVGYETSNPGYRGKDQICWMTKRLGTKRSTWVRNVLGTKCLTQGTKRMLCTCIDSYEPIKSFWYETANPGYRGNNQILGTKRPNVWARNNQPVYETSWVRSVQGRKCPGYDKTCTFSTWLDQGMKAYTLSAWLDTLWAEPW